MFSSSDTIVAIATPIGSGGLGVVRISGQEALRISAAVLARATPLQPRHATFVRAPDDQVVATYFPAPASYTGEHVVEISAHGSPVVLRAIVRRAMDAGARLAEPGEFTLRAFVNGRIDLIQAEAVADLIDAVTPVQARAACDQLDGTLTAEIGAIDGALFELCARLEASLDFPEEGYHFAGPVELSGSLREVAARLDALVQRSRQGRLVREGARLAIVGAPNVGKSSLFNALVGANRAIVAPVPGTTRDMVSETADVNGLKIAFVDTAGIRRSSDEIEREGVARANAAWAAADAGLLVLDGSRPLSAEDTELLGRDHSAPRVVVVNKSDLPAGWRGPADDDYVRVSALTGDGLDALRSTIVRVLEGPGQLIARDCPMVTNVRHAALVDRARAAVWRSIESVEAPEGAAPEELVLIDLADARAALEEITGQRTPDEVLSHIFSRFCIGK